MDEYSQRALVQSRRKGVIQIALLEGSPAAVIRSYMYMLKEALKEKGVQCLKRKIRSLWIHHQKGKCFYFNFSFSSPPLVAQVYLSILSDGGQCV